MDHRAIGNGKGKAFCLKDLGYGIWQLGWCWFKGFNRFL